MNYHFLDTFRMELFFLLISFFSFFSFFFFGDADIKKNMPVLLEACRPSLHLIFTSVVPALVICKSSSMQRQ